MENKRKPPKLIWRIIISAVGAALIYIAVFNLALYFFGDTASISVTTRRIGSANDQYELNQRYEWSVDYTFMDKNGVLHSGHTIQRSGDLPRERTAGLITFLLLRLSMLWKAKLTRMSASCCIL